MKELNQVSDQVWWHGHCQLWNQLWSQIESQVGGQVNRQVNGRVWSQVDRQVWEVYQSIETQACLETLK